MLDELNNLANCAACRTTLEWALDATDSPTCLFPLTQVPLWGIPRRCSQLKWTPPASPARRSSPKVSGAEGRRESFPLYLIILARPTEDGRASERLRSSPSLPHPFCLLRGARRSPFCMTQGRSHVPQGLSERTSYIYNKSTMTLRSELISLQEIEDHVKGHLVCFRG